MEYVPRRSATVAKVQCPESDTVSELKQKRTEAYLSDPKPSKLEKVAPNIIEARVT